MLHEGHLQASPPQALIFALKMTRLSEDFISSGELFHILGPRERRHFTPNLTWFGLGVWFV